MNANPFPLIRLTILLALVSCSAQKQESLPGDFVFEDIAYARNLEIAKGDSCAVVRIRDPWDTLSFRRQYVLVGRDCPLPSQLPEGELIRIPVLRASVYSSVHTSMLERINALDVVSGVCEPQYLTSEAAVRRLENGLITDLGPASGPSIERIVETGSEVIIASPFENCSFGAAEKLDIPIVEAVDYMENHPLGRTEWVKFFGLLTGREAEADSIFKATEEHYLELKALAASASEHPTVMLERKEGASWGLPGGESYIGMMHEDAGAEYIFKYLSGARNVGLPFETVLEEASDADFWFIKHGGKSGYGYSDLKEEYLPYSYFKAFKDSNIFVCSTMSSTYYEDIALNPDLILEDFIAIYHPELLPNHINRYYFPME